MNSTCTCLFCPLVDVFCHYSSQGLLSPGSELLDRLQVGLKSLEYQTLKMLMMAFYAHILNKIC